MRFKSFPVIFLLMTTYLFSQSPPEVSNVTFSERTDSSFIVDIYYDLNDLDGDLMAVSLEVSEDGGKTWTFSADSLQGDVGVNIGSGTGKHIIWKFGAEHNEYFSRRIQVKVTADDYNIEYGTMTDIDSNVYKTVKIGNQVWMAENLKVTHYRNGDPIPQITNDAVWYQLTTGGYCYYGNDSTYNAETYGALYNWYAFVDSRNIAPEGWHVPTDAEWKQLEIYLGMSQADADTVGYRGLDEGDKLKEAGTTHWSSPNAGTNSSGFSALPGGYRYGGIGTSSGKFYNVSLGAHYWSSTEVHSSDVWYRLLYYYKSGVGRSDCPKENGYSVRLVRD